MLARTENYSYDPLLRHARDRQDNLTLAFASAIELSRSSSRIPGNGGFGLDVMQYGELLNNYFPGARSTYLSSATRFSLILHSTGSGFDEFDELLSFLLEFRADDSRESLWLAHAIASCCMGEDHLWQDMGLPDRQALSNLIARYFPELSARNSKRMRWKKFFYKALCDRNGARVCRSPSCADCSEYSNCFGPEED